MIERKRRLLLTQQQRPQEPGRRGAVGQHLVVPVTDGKAGLGGAEVDGQVGDFGVADVVGGQLGRGQQRAAPLAGRLAFLLVAAPASVIPWAWTRASRIALMIMRSCIFSCCIRTARGAPSPG